MKQFKLLILLLVIGFVADAQINYLPMNSRYRWIAGKFDSTLHIPSGATPGLKTGGYDYRGAIFYRTSDSTVYVYTGTQWISVKGAGGSSDSTIFATVYRLDTAKTNLRTSINTKLNISDTASMLTNYVRAQRLIDTAAAIRADMVSGGSVVDSIKVVGDEFLLYQTGGSDLHAYLYPTILDIDSTYEPLAGQINDSLWRLKSLRLQFGGSTITPTVDGNKISWNITGVAGNDSAYVHAYLTEDSTALIMVRDNNGRDTFHFRVDTTGWAIAGIDTTSLSNRINLKLNISDTAAMLNGYTRLQRFIDSLSAHTTRFNGVTSSLALKLNITDTANIKPRLYAGTNVTITGTYPDLTIAASGGASATFTKGLYSRNDTVMLANNRDIEYITQPITGSSLASGWTAVSSPSYTVSNGKFVFSGGSNNYTSYIRNDAGVLSEGASVEAYVIINTAGTTDQGVRIGWKSYNSFGYAHDVHAGYISGTSAGSTGKAVLYGSTGASTSYSDSARTSSNGDTLYYKLTRTGLEYRIYVKNITKGWKLQKTVQTTPMGSPFVAHNSAYVSVIPGAGDYTVYGLKYTIHAPLVTENYFVGNSITYGQAAASEGARYASRIGNPGNNIGSGGGADATAQVLARVNEIKAIKPKRVLLMIGGNDVLFSVSSATWKANYLAIRDSLVANGIEVVHLLPTPRTATDLRDLKLYIDTSTTFRSDKIIDTWTPLLTGTYSTLTKYNYDNTHPNEAGMGEIAATINDGLHYSNGAALQVNKNLIAKNGYVLGTDAGTGTDQYKAGGLIGTMSNSTSKYIQLGYYSSYGWINAVHEGSSYDPVVLVPAGNTYVGIRETSPDVQLDVKSSTAGSTSIMDLNHAGSYSDSAAGQELRMNFQNSGTNVARIASFVDDDGSTFGLKFYTMRDGGFGLNANPTLRLNGKDSASTFLGKLTINKNLYALGTQAGLGNKSVRWNSSGGEFTYVDTAKGGTYTPTLYNTTNVAASTAFVTNYSRNGDTYTVWGTVSIDATAAATITELGMSLPIAAGIANVYDLGGTGAFGDDGTVVQIKGDNANGRAMFRLKPVTDTDNTYSFLFVFKYVVP